MKSPAYCTRLIAGALFSLAVSGCGSSPDDLVLARVGGEQITAAEFREFSQRIPAGMKQDDTPLAADRNLLESLIDKKLLLMEARRTRVEDDPWFRDKLDQHRRARILELYNQREISSKIAITEDEITQRYHATGRDRALRFSGIMLKTREEALQILEQLENGADFHKLAAERSLHKKTGERGGDVGGYKRKDQVNQPLAERLFRLQVGELSEPIPQRFSGELHYAVFKILDEMPVPLEISESNIREELSAQKRAVLIEALTDSVNRQYSPRIHGNTVQFLNQLSRAAESDLDELPEADGALPICQYEGGEITLDKFLQDTREVQLGWQELTDSARVVEILQRLVIPQHLFLEEAYALGLHQDPSLLARLEGKREELLLSALRRREVDQHVTASAEEARAFYEQHPEKFTPLKTLVIGEILVADEARAQQIRDELAAGADVEPLVDKWTIRPGVAHHGGKIRLNLYTRFLFPEIYDLANQLEIGEIGGPLRVREGYSVFKVLEREVKGATYDRDSPRRARAYVRIDKAQKSYVRYVRGLRERYPVEILDQNLQLIQIPARSGSG